MSPLGDALAADIFPGFCEGFKAYQVMDKQFIAPVAIELCAIKGFLVP